MPPRTRRTSAAADMSSTLVLGVIGIGVIDAREIEATFSDLMSAKGIDKAEVIFAATNDSMGDGSWEAFEFLGKTPSDGLALAAVVRPDGDADDVAIAGGAEDYKSRIIKVPGDDIPAVIVVDELIKAKAAGADARLVVFLVTEEEDENDGSGQYAAIESAVQGGIPAFNICDGMDKIDIGDPEPEQTPEPEPEAPKRRGRGRPPKAAEPEAEAATEAPAAEEEKPPARTRRAAAKTDEPGEAQETVSAAFNGSDAAVGSILDLFATMVADKVIAALK